VEVRRKIRPTNLKQVLRLIDPTEPMFAKIEQLGALGKGPRQNLRGLGDNYLATVTGCAHPGGAMNIQTDVVTSTEHSRPRVHPDSNSQGGLPWPGIALNCSLCGQSRRHCVRGGSENAEEGVTFGVYFDSLIRLDGFGYQPVVLTEQRLECVG